MQDRKKIEEGVRLILEGLGEDLEKEGLKDTPRRVADFYVSFFKSKKINLKPLADWYDGKVYLKEIPFYSLCEHHLLPFFGKIEIVYKVNGKIIGLSKIVRVLSELSSRLQVQERLTVQIADTFITQFGVKDIYVKVEARHMCLEMRNLPAGVIITEVRKGGELK